VFPAFSYGDVYTIVNRQRNFAFEWDEEKNRRNQVKYGLSFEVAIKAFDDPYAIYEFNSTAGNEDWEQVTGRIEGGLLIALVVYVIKRVKTNGQEIYRIISARKASPGERRRYAETAY